MMTRDEILAAKDCAPVPFDTKDWGKVYLRQFTGAQRGEWDEFAAGALNAEGRLDSPGIFRAKLVQLSLCDASGALVFSPADVPLLLSKSGSVLEEVFVAASTLNRLTRQDVEDARKSFFALPPAGTGTDSLGNSDGQ